MLEVRLLGTFAIQRDGKPVVITSRVAQSLLAYLVLSGGHLHRREKLAGMFWPEAAEEKARAYLRHELWRLRKAFSARSTKNYFLIDDIHIGFDASAEYWLDVAVLRKAMETNSIDDLVQALSVYQGELLPGFYEDWVTLEREHLQTLYEQNMAVLLKQLEDERRWQDILEWAERWISSGAQPEVAYRALMLAYDALGDRAKVALTYERYVHALRELDLKPSEEVRALASHRMRSLSLPIPLTSFIGRAAELKEVAELLSKSRLVTLTGTGGVGKTRLAIQVAADVLERFTDGVWFLDLAPLSDPALIPGTLANLLGLRESGTTHVSMTDSLANYFRARTALVIFDNCEHLIQAAAQLVHALLTSCECFSVLATSRERLRVSGERTYRVPSLETPKANLEADAQTIGKIEAVRLFTERAAVDSPGFMINPQNAWTIARICQRLDGIPLAIELAAARTPVLTVEQILKRLDDRFNLLTGGLRTSLPRQQTLRAMIEWSYGLLSEKERILFQRLAVFVGGWTLEAAEEVCSIDGIESVDVLNLLSQLLNKSLIVVETSNGENRYRRLETIRQYAQEIFIESHEEEHIRVRHLEYFLKLSAQAESGLRGASQREWYVRLNRERENLRAALQWADQTNVEAGLYLSGRLHRFWENFDLREGARWIDKFLEKPTSKGYPLARAKALCTKAWLMLWSQEFDLARAAAQECLELCRAHGDKYGEIDSLLALGISDYDTWNTKLMELYEQAYDLSKLLGDQWRQAQALVRLSWIDSDYSRRISYLEQAVELFRKVGDLEFATAQMIWLGNQEALNGNLQAAQHWLDEAVKTSQHLEVKEAKADILYLNGIIALIKGEYQRARIDLQEVALLQEELGHQWSLPWTYARLGYLALHEGNLTEASQIFTNTAQIFQKDQFANGVVFTLEGMASLHVEVGKPERAAVLIGWANATREEIGDSRPRLEQAHIDQITLICIAKIGEVAFSKAYDEGMKMTLEEAVSYAIESF